MHPGGVLRARVSSSWRTARWSLPRTVTTWAGVAWSPMTEWHSAWLMAESLGALREVVKYVVGYYTSAIVGRPSDYPSVEKVRLAFAKALRHLGP